MYIWTFLMFFFSWIEYHFFLCKEKAIFDKVCLSFSIPVVVSLVFAEEQKRKYATLNIWLTWSIGAIQSTVDPTIKRDAYEAILLHVSLHTVYQCTDLMLKHVTRVLGEWIPLGHCVCSSPLCTLDFIISLFDMCNVQLTLFSSIQQQKMTHLPLVINSYLLLLYSSLFSSLLIIDWFIRMICIIAMKSGIFLSRLYTKVNWLS